MKPIPFSTEMVRAILDGHKTVTRRIVKRVNTSRINFSRFIRTYADPCVSVVKKGRKERMKQLNGVFAVFEDCSPYSKSGFISVKAPYQPGDIMYVRETWRKWSGGYSYKADAPEWACQWKPSIHMPKEAARLFLRVTNVRVERLQDITEEQAIAEGVRIGLGGSPHFSCRDAFSALWDSLDNVALAINGWAANPWVWVIEFERISKEEAIKR